MGRENDPGTLDNLDLKGDGPTFEEYVEAGYEPSTYPPEGYTAQDTEGYRTYLAEKRRTEQEAHRAPADRELSDEEAAAATERALNEQLQPPTPAAPADPVEHAPGLGDGNPNQTADDSRIN